MTTLTVESINSIFEKFLPLVKPYSNYFYWKKEQYQVMVEVSPLIKANAHYTLYGFFTILEIIFSYPNNRHESKEYWLDIIQNWFKINLLRVNQEKIIFRLFMVEGL